MKQKKQLTEVKHEQGAEKPLSQTVENAHASGDGALAKTDEELPVEKKDDSERPAY